MTALEIFYIKFTRGEGKVENWASEMKEKKEESGNSE